MRKTSIKTDASVASAAARARPARRSTAAALCLLAILAAGCNGLLVRRDTVELTPAGRIAVATGSATDALGITQPQRAK